MLKVCCPFDARSRLGCLAVPAATRHWRAEGPVIRLMISERQLKPLLDTSAESCQNF